MEKTSRAADERLLKTFLELVRIDSPSGRESACAHYCEQALRDLGCTVIYDSSAGSTGSDTGNLIAELSGTASGTLLLSAHLDCVDPCLGVEPVVVDDIVIASGDTILGADDKAGLAAAIECIRRLTESTLPYPSVKCVFTVQEERGLHGAKHLNQESVEADLCLVLDAAGSPGGIVVGAPTHYTFVATILGRAAHAGVEPEAGVSAIRIAAEAIGKLPAGRLDEVTTANVGTVNGGTATNVIAAAVQLTGECRSLHRDRVEQVKSEIDSTIRQSAISSGGSADIEWCLEYEGFKIADDDPAVALMVLACEDVGLKPITFTTGGGSDANVIASLGVPTVALSCGMEGVHGTSEQIRVADLEALTALCVAAARRLGL